MRPIQSQQPFLPSHSFRNSNYVNYGFSCRHYADAAAACRSSLKLENKLQKKKLENVSFVSIFCSVLWSSGRVVHDRRLVVDETPEGGMFF